MVGSAVPTTEVEIIDVSMASISPARISSTCLWVKPGAASAWIRCSVGMNLPPIHVQYI